MYFDDFKRHRILADLYRDRLARVDPEIKLPQLGKSFVVHQMKAVIDISVLTVQKIEGLFQKSVIVERNDRHVAVVSFDRPPEKMPDTKIQAPKYK